MSFPTPLVRKYSHNLRNGLKISFFLAVDSLGTNGIIHHSLALAGLKTQGFCE